MVEPNANVSGSTSVACSPDGALAGVYGSALICVTPGCAAWAGVAAANPAASAPASSTAARRTARGHRGRGVAPGAGGVGRELRRRDGGNGSGHTDAQPTAESIAARVAK